ncbi:MAG: tetratricopeptide repeat protein [Terracidiphilus sp.]|jgi:Flp pilus assembly protein TadD
MSRTSLCLIAVIAVIAVSGSHDAWAGDVLAITIPRRSELTPVQRLNREGVEAVKRQQYEKAATLFYKAYLYDPADPFTLNNLGYISEVQGELDRAHKFYALASEQGCNANIDRSNAKQLEGKPMQYAFESLQDVPMRVNRMNVDAMDLLSANRGFQAVALLREALSLDPQNPFTLNNLGVADESIGDYDNALRSYGAAAESHSSEHVVVTLDRSWRGRSVSAMALASARRLEERMKKMDGAEVSAVLFTLRGVSATNQNDWLAARQDFLHAYSLDPASAFSLNNRGYVAERDGDLETAQFFYEKARKAGDSNTRVGLATDRSAEGKKLFTVATDSDHQVDGVLDKYSQDRRRQTGPIELTLRNNTPGGDSSVPPERPSPSNVPPAVSPSAPQPPH